MRSSIFSRLSAASPDWSSRTYGGVTEIRLAFIDSAQSLYARGVGTSFLAAGEAALADAQKQLDSIGARPYVGGS